MLVAMNFEIEKTVLTENEVLASLDNWGRWKFREDHAGSGKLHQLYRMMLEFGHNPMREIKTRKGVDESEALLMQRILRQMQKGNNRELWYDVLYETYVMRRNKTEAARELDCCQRTVRRKLSASVGWLCDNSRMFFEIWDLEKELIS
jgi:hypothetical protein